MDQIEKGLKTNDVTTTREYLYIQEYFCIFLKNLLFELQIRYFEILMSTSKQKVQSADNSYYIYEDK